MASIAHPPHYPPIAHPGGPMLPQPHTQPLQSQYTHPSHQGSYSGTRGNQAFRLEVAQQPERARMCGFGDKDRRPITPPICVRLIITDSRTGKEVDFKDVNPQLFVLNVDLWDSTGSRCTNLVRSNSSNASMSISMAETTEYPPPTHMEPAWMQHPYGANGDYRHPGASAYGDPRAVYPPAYNAPGMYTRNLIGSVAVSASSLQDTNNKPGFWFVLQDLSVRQEGSFRLKFNFMDVAGEGNAPVAVGTPKPILATTFSEVFQVHSAKKFPGVKESTPLSKCFAQQGVKIPIRKDGKSGKDDDEDD